MSGDFDDILEASSMAAESRQSPTPQVPMATVTPSTSSAAYSTGVGSVLALEHVLDHVFALSSTSGLRLALDEGGYRKISSVLAMSPSDIAALSYTPRDSNLQATGPPRQPNRMELGLLDSLKGFAVHHQTRLNRTFAPREWMVVTEEEFEEYQCSPVQYAV